MPSTTKPERKPRLSTPISTTGSISTTDEARGDPGEARAERSDLAASYDKKAQLAVERAEIEAKPELPPVKSDVLVGDGQKVTSPEMAELAGRFLRMTAQDMVTAINYVPTGPQFVADVRRLAASVLAQVEHK